MPFGLLADLCSNRPQWMITAAFDTEKHTPHFMLIFLHQVEGDDDTIVRAGLVAICSIMRARIR